MPLATLADIDMYYESSGDGTPLLVIGGTSQTIDDLQPMIDVLAQRFRVIALENRGAGRTSAPRGRYSIKQMARDTLALMDSLGVERAHVLGISMGGRIALCLALDQPERIGRLALISTSARVANPVLRARLWAGMMLNQARGGTGPHDQPPHAQRAQFWASTLFSCADRLAEITQPAIVVHGRADVVVPLQLGEQMHRGLPDSRLVLLDGGHRIAVDPGDRDAVCAAVVPFLAGTDA